MSESEKNGQNLSPEEYRRRLLLERRRTMRTVRNSLLGIAVLAILWWLLLLYQDRTNDAPVPEEPAAGTNSASDQSADESADGDREFSPFEYK